MKGHTTRTVRRAALCLGLLLAGFAADAAPADAAACIINRPKDGRSISVSCRNITQRYRAFGACQNANGTKFPLGYGSTVKPPLTSTFSCGSGGTLYTSGWEFV